MCEDLLKVLRETDFSDGCPCGAEPMCKDKDCIILQAADAIEELEEKAQALAETLYAYEHPWIPVSSALPEDGQDVLAVQSWVGEVRIIPANYDRGVWYDCVYNRQAEHITHWMPVPKPPKEMVTDSNQQEGTE